MYIKCRKILMFLLLCTASLHSANRYDDDYTNYHSHNFVFEETSPPTTTTSDHSPVNYQSSANTRAERPLIQEYDFSQTTNTTYCEDITCSVTPSELCPKTITKIVYVPYPVQYNCQTPSPQPCPALPIAIAPPPPPPQPVRICVSKPCCRGGCSLRFPRITCFSCLPSFSFFPDCCSWERELCHNRYSQIYFGLDTFSTKIVVSRRSRGVNNFFGTRRDEREYKNTLVGTVLGFTYRVPCGIYFNTEFDWLTGDLNRKNHRPSRYAHYYLGYGRVGYNWLVCNCLLVTPYVGLGYDYVDNHIRGSDLTMRYRDYYGIAGGRIDFLMYDGFSIGIDGQWQPQLDSSVRLSNYKGIRFKLEHKSGYELQLPLCYRFCCDQLVLTISPYTRRYKDGRSHTFRICDDSRIRIPQQTHQNWGGKVNLGFLF